MNNHELLQYNFHKQIARLAESGKTLEEFMQDPDEIAAEATLEAIRTNIRNERRALR